MDLDMSVFVYTKLDAITLAQSPAPWPGIKILRYFCGQNGS